MALDLQQAADMLGVSPATVRRWARQGRLGVRRQSGEFRFESAELQRWARNQGLHLRRGHGDGLSPPVAPEPCAGVPGQGGGELCRALLRGAVLHAVRGSTPDEVLTNLVERAPLPESEDREGLLAALRDREAIMPTAVGDGIALPHPRVPSTEFVAAPVLVIAMLENAVAWGALDGAPVTAVVLLLSPSPKEHLRLLAWISYVLRQPRFVAALRGAMDADELRALVAELERGRPA